MAEIQKELASEPTPHDWTRFDAMTDAELEASIDPSDEADWDWSTVQAHPVGLREGDASQLAKRAKAGGQS